MTEGKDFAFPQDIAIGSPINKHGLTKREYFAAMAMQGLLSNPDYMKDYAGEKYLLQEDIISKVSISHADSLIKILNENTSAQS